MTLARTIHDWLSELPEDQFRRLKAVEPESSGMVRWADGRSLVDFASNDYLGLSHHPELINRANQWMQAWGTGARASRLISGNFPALVELEQKLAHAKNTESALIFGSGFQVNSSILAALLSRKLQKKSSIHVFTDRLCHASFHFGLSAAGVRQNRFRHNNFGHLEEMLQSKRPPGEPALIATESVFSMEGDRLNVREIRSLAAKYGALLYVDEAHATGLYGPRGMGLLSDSQGMEETEFGGHDEVVIGTFGKALGSFGAYVACSREIRDYLVNACAGLIYSTGLPPAVLGCIDAALDLVPAMNDERSHLNRLSLHLRQSLQAMGLDTLHSETQIIPVVLGDNDRVLKVSQRLLDAGFLVGAIRPPTVPSGSARLRISLSAAHKVAQVDAFVAAMQEFTEEANA